MKTPAGPPADLSGVWDSDSNASGPDDPGPSGAVPPGDRRVRVSPPAPSRHHRSRADLSLLAHGGLLSLAGTIANALLGFVLVVIITRGLHAGGAGLLFEAIALFTILSNTTEFGADTGLVRAVPKYRATGRTGDIRETLWIATWPVLLGSTIVAALVFIYAPELSRVFIHGAHREQGIPYIRALAPFLPLASAMTVFLAGTRGFGTMAPYVYIYNIGIPVSRPLLILPLTLAAGFGGVAIAVAWAIPLAAGFVLALVVLLMLLRRAERSSSDGGGKRTRSPRLASEFWRFSAPRGLAGFFQITAIWLGILLVGALGTTSQAGIYAAVTRFVMVGTFAIQAIGLAIAPQISDLLSRAHPERAQTLFQTATWWLMALSWPLYFALAVFAPLLMRIFGREFVVGAPALVILSFAMLVFIGTGNNKIVLLMGGKSTWNLVITGCAVALNVGLSFLLIPRYGVTGAAIAFGLGITVDNLATTVVVRVLQHLQPFGRGYPVVGLGSAVCFGAIGLLVRAAFGLSIPSLLLYGVISTALYIGLLWRFRGVLQFAVLGNAVRYRRAGSGARAQEDGAGLGLTSALGD